MSRYSTASKLIIFFSIPLLILIGFIEATSPVYSGQVEDLQNEINQKTDELNKQKSILSDIEKKIADISNSNLTVSQKITEINKEMSAVQDQIDTKTDEINQKLQEIEDKQTLLNNKKETLDNVSSKLYMQSRYDGGQFIFSADNLDKILKNIFVKSAAISILRDDIEVISGEFVNLTELKSGLEAEKTNLDSQKKDLDSSYKLLADEKAKLQQQLSTQNATKSSVKKSINGLSADLSDLQYQLIIARQGGTNVDLDSVPSGGDKYGSLSGFRSYAPSNTFAVFSIGAYTHRNGMSQWGAKARAEAGQNYSTILSAYYPGKSLRTGSVVVSGNSETITTTIKTDKYGTLNLEDDYLLRLNEVPETWPMEVLKAQAIAARTYAINYTQNGRSTICTTESCQVVGDGKKTGAWRTAVQATRGMILTNSSGNAFSTQYAAVHGGWGNDVKWDTTTKSGDYSNWMKDAWESISGVSWFYKTWYRSGYTVGSSIDSTSCNRGPWLTQTEMADLVNAYQVWKAHGMNDSRIYPIHDACHSNGDPYSYTELRNLASKPVTSVNLVATTNHGGYTSTVTFYTNAGTISMTGNDFKTVYNLRAPGYLRIPQSGFVNINIEKN